MQRFRISGFSISLFLEIHRKALGKNSGGGTKHITFGDKNEWNRKNIRWFVEMAFDPHNDSSSSSSSDSNDAPKDVSSVGNASNRFDEDGNYIPVFRCLQVFLSLLFVSVGAALCVGTYASIRRRQQNDFETKASSHRTQNNVIHHILNKTTGPIHSCSLQTWRKRLPNHQ